MKNTFAILALAATAAATGFKDASPFSCPGNTDNKCTDKQSTGFDFSDLGFGGFSSYNNFNWKGFTCGSDATKRFAPRTTGKKISGSCSSVKEQSPSFGCGASIDKFSLGSIGVKPEFDCDLEFHYDMPDGSTCKTRSSCSKSGSTVKNDQCGGAKNVTIVFPPQPNKPKPTCSVDINTISFECSSSSTKPPKTTTKSTSTKTTSTSVATTTSETKGIETTSSTTAVVETTSSTSAVETSTPPATTAPPTTTLPPFGNGTTSFVETTSETTSESIKETTSETTSEHTSTFVTSFLSTSTVFTTVVSTITSCAETVTNCPANSVTTTLVTVAVSTTICPVTETRTTVHTNTKPTGKATETTSIAETTSVAETTSIAETTSEVAQTSSNTEAVGTTTTSSVTTVETLPCPSVVPQCLNTFMFSVGCSDNSDSSCYCPDEIFVKNIFNCIYAHGETAEIVSEAVIFFQGICAPYVPSNPAIATGATVTSFVTVSATATSSLAPVYTTVTVQATTVVPCTDSAGSTIASSSSTIIVSTEITVPNVAFTTGTGSASSVGLVPVTTTAAAAVTTSAAATLVTAPPAGTGSFTSKPTATGFVTVSSSHRVSAGFGLALAVMALVAAL
ncbi:hypothetical protein CONLIGDRAFT_293631 [Coniochaeta ligniaria NRRL 30616]|uniref:CFEM domain-containing protein n=1 Tax=Coniochaeta ligniaria NRRL 30616 TaxID=1408157 RepID=A0A1J7IUQ4_9PEZI|nr:hypothetical protein CONLIGDRAFT_293631 [Coniochaeta ligniaria NRRL 30616]